jgi:hypothetical protein
MHEVVVMVGKRRLGERRCSATLACKWHLEDQSNHRAFLPQAIDNDSLSTMSPVMKTQATYCLHGKYCDACSYPKFSHMTEDYTVYGIEISRTDSSYLLRSLFRARNFPSYAPRCNSVLSPYRNPCFASLMTAGRHERDQ